MTHILGIDVSKARLDLAWRAAEGTWRSKPLENTSAGLAVLATWLQNYGFAPAHVCSEASGTYREALTGHALPRKALYMPAMVTLKQDRLGTGFSCAPGRRRQTAQASSLAR